MYYQNDPQDDTTDYGLAEIWHDEYLSEWVAPEPTDDDDDPQPLDFDQWIRKHYDDRAGCLAE